VSTTRATEGKERSYSSVKGHLGRHFVIRERQLFGRAEAAVLTAASNAQRFPNRALAGWNNSRDRGCQLEG
jgi:hypothetical protein